MSDAMRYNPKSPDPISVAAYITRYYAVEKQLSADELRPIFNESVDIGERVLAGKTDLDIQKAMDLVEQARTGQAYAKLIPRSPGLSQSITARATPASVEDRMERGPINDSKMTDPLDPYYLRNIFIKHLHENKKDKDFTKIKNQPLSIESMEDLARKFSQPPFVEKIIYKKEIYIPDPLDFEDPSPFRKKWDAE